MRVFRKYSNRISTWRSPSWECHSVLFCSRHIFSCHSVRSSGRKLSQNKRCNETLSRQRSDQEAHLKISSSFLGFQFHQLLIRDLFFRENYRHLWCLRGGLGTFGGWRLWETPGCRCKGPGARPCTLGTWPDASHSQPNPPCKGPCSRSAARAVKELSSFGSRYKIYTVTR